MRDAPFKSMKNGLSLGARLKLIAQRPAEKEREMEVRHLVPVHIIKIPAPPFPSKPGTKPLMLLCGRVDKWGNKSGIAELKRLRERLRRKMIRDRIRGRRKLKRFRRT